MSAELIINSLGREQKINRVYSLSLYGRFGYAVTFIAGIPFCGFMFLPFSASAPKTSLVGSLLCYLLGVCSWFLMIYSCTQLFRRTPRFVIDENGFFFRGLFCRRFFEWSDVEKITLGINSRIGFVFLLMRLNSPSFGRKFRKFDVSGLKPNYNNLIVEMNRHLSRVSSEKGLNSNFCPETLLGEYLIMTKEKKVNTPS